MILISQRSISLVDIYFNRSVNIFFFYYYIHIKTESSPSLKLYILEFGLYIGIDGSTGRRFS